MKGWLIIRHSLRQVFGNLTGALRVSLVLYLVQGLVGFALGVGMVSMGASGPMTPDSVGSGFWVAFLVALLVAIVTSLWIAVAWHRFILLGEESSVLPPFKGDRMLAYFLRSLGYAIILIIIGIIWGLIVGFATGGLVMDNPVVGMVIMAFLVYLPILVVGFRMMADLPAAALGADVGFMSGWEATKGKSVEIAVMAVILIALALAVSLLGAYVFAGIPALGLIWQAVIGWVQMMVGVSVLTTLYGHYIEKRDLV